ncbi:M10 family metallopeptidase C-terminal domain-containing protein [Haematospirillum jordaniae]|uniref:M10 family metallopeptidase C-terminal domain-containing protein n=1 Tax=Haematospirillum jordaniae TaxID=1549855 RepID=UPI002474BD35|nr:M10 family metallopeptidase C-terminal domain-containing protein [Haematospirillum jordaniae]
MSVEREFQPTDMGISRAVIGTRGNDEIIGTGRRDRMIGEEGNDRLFGRDGDDFLIGAEGDDYLDGGDGADRLMGNGGADTFVFRELASDKYDMIVDFKSVEGDKIDVSVISEHMIRSGFPALRFSGQEPSPYSVWYRGGPGEQGVTLAVDVDGDASPDRVVWLRSTSSLSSQDLVLTGPQTKTPDSLVQEGTEHNDRLVAGFGPDHMDGRGGEDAIDYRDALLPVNVVLAGSQSAAVLVDGREKDTIVNIEHAFGGFGDDWLAGDDGSNILSGRGGSDILVGGQGADTLTGGLGADRFLYRDSVETHGDLIVDFNRSQGDVVDVSSIDANVYEPGRQEFVFSGQLPQANSIWYRIFIEGDGTVHVQGDVDGDPDVPEIDIAMEGVSSVNATDLGLLTAIRGNAVDFSAHIQPIAINLDQLAYQGVSSVVGALNAWNRIQGSDSVTGALVGGDKGNNIVGASGDDTLRGGRGNDSLHGEGGRDILDGGDGDDFLRGGIGADILTGGPGMDRFHYRTSAEVQGDVISDFNRDQGDWVDLYRIDANTHVDGWQLFTFSGEEPRPHALWSGPDPDGSGVRLYGDTDGNPETVEIDLQFLGIEVLDPSDVQLPVSRDGTLDFSDLIHYDLVNLHEHHPFLQVMGPRSVSSTLLGGSGANVLIGGTEDDSVIGDEGNDTLYGMEGDDHVNGGAGDDYLDGGEGDDLVTGGPGADKMTGGRGADRFVYSSAEEAQGDVITDFNMLEGDWIDLTRVDAGSSSDEPSWSGFVFAGTTPQAHALWSRFDRERFGTELLGDTDGNPETAEIAIYLKGTEFFGPEALQLPSLAGDTVDFSATTKHIYIHLDYYNGVNHVRGPLDVGAEIHGNADANTLSGGDRGDTLSGHDGDDTLIGGGGDDQLYGERGDDVLRGGDGRDVLDGGPGADALSGGAGADRFRYTLASYTVDDVILDFNRDEGDWLDLHQVDANIYEAGWQVMSFGGAKAVRHSLWFKPGEDGNSVTLCGDTDGNIRTHEVSLEIRGITSLQASDFDMPVLRAETPDLSGALQALRGVFIPSPHDTSKAGFRFGDSALSGETMPEQVPGSDEDGSLQAPLVISPGDGPYDTPQASISGYTASQFSKFLLRVLDDEGRFSGLQGRDAGNKTPPPETLDFSMTSHHRHIDIATYRGFNNVVGPADSGAEIRGDSGPNVLTGGDGPDQIYGEAGDDILVGGSGDDTLHGGSGNDILTGEAGNDTLYGDDGNDILTGGTGADIMHGGRGHDTLTGDAGNDTLEGGDGNDTLSGGAGADILRGGLGRDTLSGGWGADRFHYRSVDETVGDVIADFSPSQGDWIDLHGIDSGDNPDVWQGLVFHGANVRPHSLWYQVDGNGKGVHLYGDTDGNVDTREINIAVKGVAVLEARSVPLPVFTMDTVDFSSSRSYTAIDLADYRGISNLVGSRIVGMELHGTGADNSLTGGDGDDHLHGGGGNDVLAGGDGKDVLTGGSGADSFVYWSAVATVGDVITDFSQDEGDTLDFSLIDANTSAAGVQDLVFSDTVPRAHAVWYVPNAAGSDIVLCGDTDGHVETTEIAFLLKGVSSLAASDFLF